MISRGSDLLISAIRSRMDRARESLRDPGMQTALTTAVACLEGLLILFLLIKLDELDSLAWSLVCILLLFVIIFSPALPSSMMLRFFKGAKRKHIKRAYGLFFICVFIMYLVMRFSEL